MPHHSQIGVYRTDKLLPVSFHVIGRACRQAVQAVDGIVAEADCAVAQVFPPRKYHPSDKQDTFRVMLQIDLARVQRQPVFGEPAGNFRFHLYQVLFRGMDKHHVVHIPAVVLHAPFFADEMVQSVQEVKGEQLACQVADRQSARAVGMEQALVFGQSAPALGRRLADAVLFRTVEYRLTEQIEQYRQVVSPVAFVQEFFGQVIQPPLRYFHEERTDVYFQDIAIPRVVLGAEPDMFFHPFYAVERTLSLAGTVTVIDELLFQKRNEPVGYEVVYNTVAEVGGENLPFHGFVDNESDGTRRAVCAGIDFPLQFHTPAFVIALEGKGIAGIAFLFTALEIRLEDILQRNASEFLICKKTLLQLHIAIPFCLS